MRYSKGYKYKTEEPLQFYAPHLMHLYIHTSYIRISHCMITIWPGYAWDGCSGPVVDTKKNLVPSVFHDAIYQLIREGRLPLSDRIWADEEFGRLCVKWGTWGWLADVYVAALLQWGKSAALEESRTIYEVTK